MEDFNATKVTDELYAKIQYTEDFMVENETGSLFQFNPPKTGRLVDEKDLFRTFYQYMDQHTRFKYYNESPVCGYEMWFEEGEIQFVFYTPSDSLEQIYRKQLTTIYEDCDIQPTQGKYININNGDYIICTEMELNNHYFEPVKTDRFNSNPYKVILGELEKQTDINAMIQFLYKPAESDWTQLHKTNVEDHAEAVKERSSYEKGFLGRSKKVDPPDSINSEVQKIKNQKGEKGYYMDIRLIISGPKKDVVEREATQLINLYQESFTADSGQRLVPKRYEEKEQLETLLIDSIQRNPKYMRQPKAPKPYIRKKLSSNTETLIMSIDELVPLAPIPYESAFSSITGIQWADKPVPEATVGVGEEWTPLSEEENIEKEEYLGGSSEAPDATVKTPEGTPVQEYDSNEEPEVGENKFTGTSEQDETIDDESGEESTEEIEDESSEELKEDPSDDDIDYEEMLG